MSPCLELYGVFVGEALVLPGNDLPIGSQVAYAITIDTWGPVGKSASDGQDESRWASRIPIGKSAPDGQVPSVAAADQSLKPEIRERRDRQSQSRLTHVSESADHTIT